MSSLKPRKRAALRQWRRLAYVGLLGLAACGTADVPVGTVGNVTGFLGAVAADEPHAVLAARDVLSAGGNAADAAVALYFTMSVTYPNAASLGGGGACVVFDVKSYKVEAIHFPSKAPRGGGEIAIPGSPRGMAALHARYGSFRWGALVSGAEGLARHGYPVSRAFAQAMDAGEGHYSAGPGLAKLIGDGTQGLKREGDPLRQVELSSLIGQIRSFGGGYFYQGALARTFVESANEAGGHLTLQDMYDYKPEWRETRHFKSDNLLVHTLDTAEGRRFESIWTGSFEGSGILGRAQEIEMAMLADASARAYAMQGTAERPGLHKSTGFVTVDRFGNAVSCNVGMKRPFGSGRVAPHLGLLLDNPPEGGQAAASAPFVAVTPNSLFWLAGAASDGGVETLAAVRTALAVVSERKALPEAMRQPRFFSPGTGQAILHESDVPAQDKAKLAKLGVLVEVDRLGSVNMVSCRKGLPGSPELCQGSADPRGAGLSLSADY